MEEFPKSTNEQTKMEIEELSQDRINFKLSLRKKKFNDMLIKKRILPSKPEDSPWPLELFLSNLKLPADYKIIFAKEDEFLSTAFKNIKSEDILNVKYGICLFKNYITYYTSDYNKLFFNLNINFISDLLNLLEKWGDKKEKQIVFNILYIMTNYSYLNTNKKISKILLSSKGYKIWDLCFDLQDYEIMSQMIWVLDNIIYEDDESSYNLLKSNFFQKKIIYFYSNQSILRHLNENNQNNLFFIIIERGIGLLTNLLSTESSSTFHKEEKYKLSLPVFNLILKYSESNSKNIFHSCVYSINRAINDEPRLIPLIDNSNLLNDILNKKFFSEDKIVLNCNRIIGDYIANQSNLSKDFYDKCVNYEMDILFGAKMSKLIIEIYWVLSNVIHDNRISAENICKNEAFIDKTINIYKNSVDLNNIRNMSYFFVNLVACVNVNTFIKLVNKGLVDIVLNFAKNNFEESNKVKDLFELIEICLENGKYMQDNFQDKNIIKEKCDNYGLIDILRNYEEGDNEELNVIINNILSEYYNQ